MRHLHNSPVGRQPSLLKQRVCAPCGLEQTSGARIKERKPSRLPVLVTPKALSVVIFLLSPSHTKSTATFSGVVNNQRAAISVAAVIIVGSRESDRRRGVVNNAGSPISDCPLPWRLLTLRVQDRR
jgi:hypothetical protein